MVDRFYQDSRGSSANLDPVTVLTIAGSDSGGAAGLQADLKTFTALGVYGMSIVTVVTAQNSLGVEAVHTLPAEFVAQQLEVVLSDYGAAAIKTGFLGRVELIEAIAAKLAKDRRAFLLVDPVLVNHKGESMFPAEVAQAYRDHLLPLADLVTPNRREASLLTGLPTNDLDDLETAAQVMGEWGSDAVLIKGGRENDQMVDILFDGLDISYHRTSWIDTINTHGSGDTLSAAICAHKGRGLVLIEAIGQAQAFTNRAIQAGAGWRLGSGHGPVSHLPPAHH